MSYNTKPVGSAKSDGRNGGVEPWQSTDNVYANDSVYTYVTDQCHYVSEVYLIISSAISGTNNADLLDLTSTSETVLTYGSSSDVWGNSLTKSIVEDGGFGCAISISRQSDGGEPSEYLWCYDFGFSITTGSTIDGVEVSFEYIHDSGNMNIDYVQMTVYYTPPSGVPSFTVAIFG